MQVRRVVSGLASIEIWLVSLLAFASLFWIQILPAVVIAAVFFWLLRLVTTGRTTIRTPADWAILLLSVTLLVTVWVTVFPVVTLTQVLRVLSGVALYYAIANWCTSFARLRLLVLAVIAAGLGLALIAPLSVEWPTNKLPFVPLSIYHRFTLLVQDTIHPNVLAGSLVMLLPFALAYPLFVWKKITWIERCLSLISALVMFVVLLLTQSRGAWMAFGVVAFVLPWLRWRWGWVFPLIAVVLSIALVYFLGLTRVLEFIASSSTIAGIDQRFDIWRRAIYMTQDFPFTGIGMGSFSEVADILYPFFSSPGSIAHAHNLFLQVAVDLGIPGLIAWLAILLIVIFVSWQVYLNNHYRGDSLLAGVGAALLCSQIALIIHGLTDSVTWGMVRSAPMVWVVWGLAVAAFGVQKSSLIE